MISDRQYFASDRLWQCLLCSKKFHWKAGFRRHLQMFHLKFREDPNKFCKEITQLES